MLRLQHYVEVSYIVGIAFAAYDIAHLCKLRERPSLANVARLTAAVVFAPFVLLQMLVRFLHENW